MAALPKPSKKSVLKLIDDLENNPNDRLRILGDTGIVTLVAAVGTSTLSGAAITGVSSVFGLSAAAKIFGWTATLGIGGPAMTVLIGIGSLLVLFAFALTRLIHGGGLAEGRKAELLVSYRQELKTIEANERADSITDEDRTRFILSLRELVKTDAIPVDSAFRMIELVVSGRMLLSQAVSMTKACLETKLPSKFAR